MSHWDTEYLSKINRFRSNGKFAIDLPSEYRGCPSGIFSHDGDENKPGELGQCKTDEGTAYLRIQLKVLIIICKRLGISDYRMIIGGVKNYNVHDQDISLTHCSCRFPPEDQ